jgi:DNA-binding CsgD family transcriptional regulator/tetratricopeptide (TPR) repeat protein
MSVISSAVSSGRDEATATPGLVVERDHEVRELRRAVDGAMCRKGSAVVIEGSSGTGKTLLLEVALSLSRAAGLPARGVVGTRQQADVAFGAMRPLLHELRYDGVGPSDMPIAARGVFGDGGPPADGGFAMLDGLWRLLAVRLARTPMALFVDDAHWLDASSARLVQIIGARLADVPLLLAVARRPEGERPVQRALDELRDERGVRNLRLAAFGSAGVRALAVDRFGGEQEVGALAEACLRATGGHPFSVVELLGELRAGTALASEAARRAATVTVTPASVRRLVGEQLDALSPAARALGRAVAVLGPGCGLELSAEVAQLAAERAAAAARELAAAGLGHEANGLSLRHDLVRGAVLATIDADELGSLARRAAAALAARGDRERAAAALLEAPPVGDAWALAVLRDAAAQARRRGDPQLAGRLFARARREPAPDVATRAALALEEGVTLLEVAPRQAMRALAVAVEAAGDDAEQVRSRLLLADAARYAGDLARAEAQLRMLARRLPEMESDLQREVQAVIVDSSWDHLPLRPLAGELLEAIEIDDLGAGDADALLLVGVAMQALFDGQPASVAASHAARALEACASGASAPARLPLLHAIVVLAACGEHDRARAELAEARADPALQASTLGRAVEAAICARVDLAAGRLTDARATASFATDLTAHGAGSVAVVAGLALGDVLLALDRPVEAESAARRGIGAVVDPVPASLGALLRARARIALGGRRAGLLELLEAAERLGPYARNESYLPWREDAVACLMAADRHQEAVTIAEAGLANQRAFGEPVGLARALMAAATTTPEPLAPLEEAVALLQGTPNAHERARALLAHGTRLAAGGELAAARERLAAGARDAAAAGAPRLARRIADALTAAGGRPRAMPLQPTDTLTPAEWRVARLAAARQTNRDISAELFLTEKTVEGHLTSIYRKLGINGRATLGDTLRGHERPPGSGHVSWP